MVKLQKWEEKTNVWIFQATNWENLEEETLDMYKKGKPLKKNYISSNLNKKKWLYATEWQMYIMLIETK